MATNDDGIAAIAYAPSEVKTFIKNKIPVSITEETEYPFRGDIKLTVNSQIPLEFPLALHIPAWAEGATVKVNGVNQTGIVTGDFYRIKRLWKAGDKVELNFPLKMRTSKWYNDSIVIERGPLIFSLKIGENISVTKAKMNNPAPPEAADYEIKPTTPWNYGLLIPNDGLENAVEISNKPIGEFPFTAQGAPVELRLKARRVLQWKEEINSAVPPPPSPVKSAEKTETVMLIPYGSAKLRITAFPFILEN